MTDNIRRARYTKDYYRWIRTLTEHKETKVIPRIIKKAFSTNCAEEDIAALDMGCGCGELLYSLSKNYSHIYGLDYSEDALSFAKEIIGKLPNNIIKKIRLLCADACQLPFKSNSIDYIFSVDVFEHLIDKELKSLVKEMYRVLKQGGRFIVHTTPNKEYADLGYRYWIKPINIIFNPLSKKIFKKELMVVDLYKEDTHINLQTVKSIKKLFVGSGFRVHIYTYCFIPTYFIGFIYKIMSHLWPITLIYPLRNWFCLFLWAEGVKE